LTVRGKQCWALQTFLDEVPWEQLSGVTDS
jgi:hypothetical protein